MPTLPLSLHPFRLVGGTTANRQSTAATYSTTTGELTGGATSTVTLNPIVAYPSTAKELERLPEGQRTSEATTFLTSVELKTGTDAGARGDLVTYRGATWLVTSVKSWYEHAGYYESVAVRQYAS